jgi:hypothetical protein
MKKLYKILKFAVLAAVAVTAFGYVVEHLWNWLLPNILGVRPITFVQALGLFLLSKILFGGFHHHRGRGRGWKRGGKHRFEQMTPEERERFRTHVQNRWGCRPKRTTQPVTEQVAP